MSGRTNDIVNLIEYQFELISILIRIACIGEWRVSWICARTRVCVCELVCVHSVCVCTRSFTTSSSPLCCLQSVAVKLVFCVCPNRIWLNGFKPEYAHLARTHTHCTLLRCVFLNSRPQCARNRK